ncbi:hypothetical protein [Microbacterium sp. NPDC055357]
MTRQAWQGTLGDEMEASAGADTPLLAHARLVTLTLAPPTKATRA